MDFIYGTSQGNIKQGIIKSVKEFKVKMKKYNILVIANDPNNGPYRFWQYKLTNKNVIVLFKSIEIFKDNYVHGIAHSETNKNLFKYLNDLEK